MVSYLLITDQAERDRIIAELDAAYGYPNPATKTDHAVMWREHPDNNIVQVPAVLDPVTHEVITPAHIEYPDGGQWIILIPDGYIYSQAAKQGVDLVTVLGDVTPDAGVTRDTDPETGSAAQPISLALQQTNAAYLINPITGRRELVRKTWWITEKDAIDLGFFPEPPSVTPVPEPPIKIK